MTAALRAAVMLDVNALERSVVETVLSSDAVEILRALDAPLWVYDIDRKRVVWANNAALGLWRAESEAELIARDLGADMSATVELRLKQYQEDFTRADVVFHESWTLYPEGRPVTARVKFKGFRFSDGRVGMLCEAVSQENNAPEAVRSVEALLHTSTPISLFSARGETLYANPAARATYASASGALQSRFACPREADAFVTALRKQKSVHADLRMRTSKGVRWHRVTAHLCRDAVSGDFAMLLSEADVTETREAQQALEESRNAAVEASRLKSEFLANISHEIRTPLNGTIGAAQLLSSQALSEEQCELVRIIDSCGRALLSIIEDVLDISRIEAGLLTVASETFLLEEVVDEAIDAVYVPARTKSIDIHHRSDSQGHYVSGDRDRVRQVLINLLGNAVKFSGRGCVTIDVRRQADQRVVVSVIDQGQGIPVSEQSRIFERFQQIDGSARRVQGGAGLGLAISKLLIEMMGGSIGVRSKVGAGSTFWFELAASPLNPTTQRIASSSRTHPQVLRLKHPVLLAEDNQVNQIIISKMLIRAGVEVEVAADGAEALAAIEARTFAAVLMDLHMPLMSGEEALIAARASSLVRTRVPIIVLTADADPATMKRVIALGADSYVTKPVKLRELLEVLVAVTSAKDVTVLAEQESEA